MALTALYYMEMFEHVQAATSAEIQAALRRARAKGAKKANFSTVLARAGPYVHVVGSEGAANLWSLTDSGRKHVVQQLGQTAPERQHDAGTLKDLTEAISDDVVRSYVEEAVRCLEVDALRAAIVFLWTGAIRHLQERALAKHGGKTMSLAIQKHDPKARDVKRIEDFAQVKDKFQLLGFRELTMIDKGEWQTLQEALDLRNRCGHPTKYRPGVKKASSFIEDVLGIVFE